LNNSIPSVNSYGEFLPREIFNFLCFKETAGALGSNGDHSLRMAFVILAVIVALFITDGIIALRLTQTLPEYPVQNETVSQKPLA
jgi:hypothetical protein